MDQYAVAVLVNQQDQDPLAQDPITTPIKLEGTTPNPTITLEDLLDQITITTLDQDLTTTVDNNAMVSNKIAHV